MGKNHKRTDDEACAQFSDFTLGCLKFRMVLPWAENFGPATLLFIITKWKEKKKIIENENQGKKMNEMGIEKHEREKVDVNVKDFLIFF